MRSRAVSDYQIGVHFVVRRVVIMERSFVKATHSDEERTRVLRPRLGARRARTVRLHSPVKRTANTVNAFDIANPFGDF